MTERARTWIIVALITALVWLYAEAESLTRSEQETRITFIATSPDVAMRIESEDWRGTARVRIEGASAALSNAPRAIDLELGAPGVPAAEGVHEIDLRAALRAARTVQRAGLNVVDVEPATVRVRVETMQTLADVEVRPELEGLEIVGATTIEPSRATVRAPRSVIDGLRGLAGGAHVRARPGRSAMANLREGSENRVLARLALPNGLEDPAATIEPAELTVTFTLSSRTESVTTPSAPVQVLLPPREAGRWRIDVHPEDAFLRDVRMSGPREVIERLRARDLRLIAIVWLTSDDLERAVDAKRASFALVRGEQTTDVPAGLVIEAPETLVRLTIRPASDAPAIIPDDER